MTMFSNYGAIVLTISSVQMPNSCPTWESNAAVFLPSEKTVCQWKIIKSPSHSSWVYASYINFTVSIANFFKWQQNVIIFFCSFFTSVFKSSNLWWETKTTSTKIAVTRQWKVITTWNFDHRCRIDHRSLSAAWLRTAMGSLPTEANCYFWTTRIVLLPT